MPRRRSPRQFLFPFGKQGFTLIETLVALGVLTIGIIAMFVMQSGSVRANLRASQISTASVWAMDKIEEFNALPYDDELLTDKRNDGVDQDANGNGIDDDDEGGPVQDGIANFGLDQRTAETADYTVQGVAGYTMHYNIAVNQPLDNIKTIRLIVVRDADQQPFVFDYHKAASL